MVTSVATKDDAQSEICGLAMIPDHEGSTLQHAGIFMNLPMLKKSMANMVFANLTILGKNFFEVV